MTTLPLQRALQVIAPLVVGVALVGLWQAFVTLGITPNSVPTPLSVIESLTTNAGIVFEDVLITGGNALVGLIGGAVVAIVLAGLAARFAPIDGMSAPVAAVLAVVPIVALAPILNSMYGAGEQTARQIIAGIAAFVPVFVTTLRGLRQTEPVQRDLFRASAASGLQTFLKLTLRTALPYMLTGLRVASSLAVISALVAEYFGGPVNGIGSSIGSYAKSGSHALAWAYIAGGIAVGLVFFLVTGALERLVNRHRSEA
ncbi:MAG TPA: ABC transporter permease subunit [Pseudolysinimonas sp.]|nr:ABC transporter permease subunit [Pseudolysinimonas sp.]